MFYSLTCPITAWCVGHSSRGRPSCRPPPPSSRRCTRTGHSPRPRGCTENTQSLVLFASFSTSVDNISVPSLSLFHRCTGAEWTSHSAWERSIEFPRAPTTVTPPTGCARTPGSSSQPRPTGSTHPRGSRWRTACLGERRHERVKTQVEPQRGRQSERSLFDLFGDWLTDH